MDIMFSPILGSHFFEKVGLTYCILGIYQSKFTNSLWTIYKLKLVLYPCTIGHFKANSLNGQLDYFSNTIGIICIFAIRNPIA
jgi:hypothetical protein